MRVQTFNREPVVTPGRKGFASAAGPMGALDRDFDDLDGGQHDYKIAPGLVLHNVRWGDYAHPHYYSVPQLERV